MKNINEQIPTLIRTTTSPYDYPSWWHWLQLKGKRIYGPHFTLHETDAEVILKLLAWSVKDQETAQKHNIKLHKGIILAGKIGCGKTSLMNLIRHLIPQIHRHKMISCRDISNQYAKDGPETLLPYTKGSYFPYSHNPITYCFDDLGSEVNIQYYGNITNTMSEILLSRYDHYYNANPMLTHITTNLTSDQIEERYGARVRSRCRELFNLIPFPTSTIDKRI